MRWSRTVRIRSNRQTLVSPPRRASRVVIAASRCGVSIDGEITPRQTPECASEPTSTYAVFRPSPHCSGGSGISTQSNCVSSTGGWSMTAFARLVTCAHAVQAGLSPRERICRVSVGYDPSNPSGRNSSNSVTAHKCGSSVSLAET